MKIFTYESGEELKEGDTITYHGEPGKVDFVVAEKVNNPEIDYYLERFPQGGVMITAGTFGSVFLTEPEHAEDLELVARGQ